MKINIELDIPDTIEPFKEVSNILTSLLAHKYLATCSVLPPVDFKVGERSFTMRTQTEPMASHASVASHSTRYAA